MDPRPPAADPPFAARDPRATPIYPPRPRAIASGAGKAEWYNSGRSPWRGFSGSRWELSFFCQAVWNVHSARAAGGGEDNVGRL